MKRKLILLLVIVASNSYAQIVQSYYELVKRADSLYQVKQYKQSALIYSEAIKANGGLALIEDRYNAACSWALAGVSDSAFFHLDRIANKGNFTGYEQINADPDLSSLHTHARWQPLLDKIKSNKEKAEAVLNKPLTLQLDSIFENDQKYRVMTNEYESKYGRESGEMQQLWNTMATQDSINLEIVKTVLDKYGWLGPDEVGRKGSSALFLVIQHANLKTQEHYLPMMKEAVKNGKASASDLALLIDRVEMRNGRPQVYGSQVLIKDGKYVLHPVLDEINVNKRRAEVGLQPLEEYLKNWNMDYKLPGK